ncbi:ferrous iron transporter B [Pseudoxanthomonas sp. JBR18]|nr:FimV/HubP family polar landmark protein [Pseudoxanthomonas sp. JBR18]WCE06468.1 ferrous iron transporter B [Pseudoxanthomonas sp. JBR18]
MALGLGEIRVKSKPGEPLVAEIPVISSAPGELDQLRARLASPVIFERVGLQRPSGLVSQLDFAVALSDDGKPVIRVTSQDPVQTPAVSFLIEVDWGQGRLVREYSALVGAPGSVAAAGQPTIQAPTPAPSSRIQRPTPAPAPVQDAPAPESTTASNALPPPRPSAASAPAAAPVSGSVPETVTVRQGQALSQIARGLAQGGTLDQTMMALLQANPEAFIGGNINRVRSGAVLRVPQAEQIQALAAAQAAAMVRQQVSDWRQARQPIPQPANALAEPPAPASGTAPKVADARLEIAPPAADAAQRAGTTSGTDAGGEGDMLANEQLRQTREDLAARNAEVQELKAQVAELEKLKSQQAQLLAMKDSDLAAAQQRLGQGAQPGVPVWLWLGLALVIVGLAAWVLLRRRSGPRPVPVYKGPLVAPAPVTPPPREEVEASVAGEAADAPIAPDPTPAPRYTPNYVDPTPVASHDASPAPAVTPTWMSPTAKPTWHTPNAPQPTLAQIVPASASASASAPSSSSSSSPSPAEAPVTEAEVAPAVTPVQTPTPASTPAAAPSAGGRERLELAIAYLDLGDTEAARALLGQVAAGDDPQAAAEAAQLLNELG